MKLNPLTIEAAVGLNYWQNRNKASDFPNLTQQQINDVGKNMPWTQKIGNFLTLGNIEHNKLTRLNDVARNTAGASGDAALRKTAKANKEMLNAQLVNTTANINREWANAGRYTSGQRTAAIERAGEQTTTALAQANAANAQRMYEFQTTTAEDRAYKQAVLDQQPGTNRSGAVGDIISAVTSMYTANPEKTKSDLGWIGKQFGLGGGQEGGLGLTEAPSGPTTEGYYDMGGGTQAAPSQVSPVSLLDMVRPEQKQFGDLSMLGLPPVVAVRQEQPIQQEFNRQTKLNEYTKDPNAFIRDINDDAAQTLRTANYFLQDMDFDDQALLDTVSKMTTDPKNALEYYIQLLKSVEEY